MTQADNRYRKKADDKQRKLGRVQRKKWATPEEHSKIDELLELLRQKEYHITLEKRPG